MTRNVLLALALMFAVTPATAEQYEKLGPFDVHYVVVPSSFFSPEIAERYDIVRGRDRALMNVSVLDAGQTAVAVAIAGTATNLLGQQQALEFREVREGDAVYYLAQVRYTDRETLRFAVDITAPEDVTRTLQFQQQMYWDDR